MLKRAKPLENYISPLINHQKRTLVNAKVKWVKDSAIDKAVCGSRELKAASILLSAIASEPEISASIYRLHRYRGHLGLPNRLKLSTFLRKYPNIFDEFRHPDSGGTPVPWFRPTPEALEIQRTEMEIIRDCNADVVIRLRKLLMMMNDRTLPLQTIDQLRWDIGLPFDYEKSLENEDLFLKVPLSDGQMGLKLNLWDNSLAVSHLEMNSENKKSENGGLAFPVGFPRGFGLTRKFNDGLKEFQQLPYTSPYADASHLDPQTDVSEKRIVGVFHELLHLTLQKRTERKNVSNLGKPLGLPQKFTKVFDRHPGIFYISRKGDTFTVVLREEAYDHDRHPLVDLRERLRSMIGRGFLDQSRRMYNKKEIKEYLEQDFPENCFIFPSDLESEFNFIEK